MLIRLCRQSFIQRLNSRTKTSNNTSVFDRMVNQITTAAQNSNASSAAATAASAVSSEGARGLKHLMKLGGITIGENKRRNSSENLHVMPNSGRPSVDLNPASGTRDAPNASGASMGIQVTEKDGQISLDVAERMLRWHAEAVGRMLELSSISDA